MTACDIDQGDTGQIETNPDKRPPVASRAVDSSGSNQPWEGAASGYIGQGNPTSDRIELFIRLGQVLAATSVYRVRAEGYLSHADPAVTYDRVRSALDEKLMASSAEIAPTINAKMSNSEHLKTAHQLLLDLTRKEQLDDLLNLDRAQRQTQLAARQKIFDLHSRINAIVLAFFPSRHEFLLASSALIREAGDKMAVAVSADGLILDVGLLEQAYALIERSTKLDPKNITFCDSHRQAMLSHKNAVADLLDQIVPIVLGEQIDVTASEVYRLAMDTQNTAEEFSLVDDKDCG